MRPQRPASTSTKDEIVVNKTIAKTEWHPASWQGHPAAQQATYPDSAALERAVSELGRLPPITNSWEIDALKEQIAAAQRGAGFVLQGGDCAESFDECTSENIVAKLKILLQMSLVMIYGLKKPVVRIGRMAGQYAKPRSADTETRDGQTLPSFRGDLVNRAGFTPDERIPDPQMILRGYERAALTLNFVRSLVDGGFADLHHPEYWDLDWVGHSQAAEDYHQIVRSISNSLDFLETVSGRHFHRTMRADIYAAHEGLHLPYEQAQTRFVGREGRERWYDLTTHFPWIGMRTAELDGAHVEYFRGIANPVGVKVGAGMTREWIQGLVRVLNPDNEPGRLTLIHRYGATGIRGRQGDRLTRVVGVRPDARQHREHRGRRQDAPLRECRRRTGSGVSRAREHGHARRRRASRTDRRERHRMHGRRTRADRCRPRASLQVDRRPAPQLRAGDGNRYEDCRTLTRRHSPGASPSRFHSPTA
jgi:3-deoxy-7-phosphoheptulonate synthase